MPLCFKMLPMRLGGQSQGPFAPPSSSLPRKILSPPGSTYTVITRHTFLHAKTIRGQMSHDKSKKPAGTAGIILPLHSAPPPPPLETVDQHGQR